MARVDSDEVKAILETSMGDDPLEAFITVAHLVVDNSLLSSGYDDATLKEIERWLAAHFASAREHPVKTEQVGQSQISYQFPGKDGLGLDATFYGQQCKLLDSSGILASQGKRKVAIYAVESFDDTGIDDE